MKKSYKLTIVLLTYNRAASGYLQEAIDAILNQSYSDFELLIFDNNSTDNTSEIVLRYNDSRIYYVKQPKGGNPTTSYNHALWMSRGEYVIFTHDDDIMEPTLIEKQMRLLKSNPELLCVSSNVSLIDEKGKLIQKKLYNIDNDLLFSQNEYLEKYFEEKLWFPTPTIMYHRDTYFNLLSKYLEEKNPKYFASGDLWAVFNLNLQGSVGLIAEPLLKYRQHRNQESRNVDQSNPVLDVIKMFLDENKGKKELEHILPSIWGYLIRFKLQDILFNYTNKKKLLIELKQLRKSWTNNVPTNKRAVDSVIPFEIFINLFKLENTISQSSIDKLFTKTANSGARIGYKNWIKKINAGFNIFNEKMKGKNIAILGSMLNSYLLVESAKQSGANVLYCFDSSPARIGKRVFDIEIKPLSELSIYANSLDLIVLSSEHDQENALIKLLQEKIPTECNMEIISWKELAKISF